MKKERGFISIQVLLIGLGVLMCWLGLQLQLQQSILSVRDEMTLTKASYEAEKGTVYVLTAIKGGAIILPVVSKKEIIERTEQYTWDYLLLKTAQEPLTYFLHVEWKDTVTGVYSWKNTYFTVESDGRIRVIKMDI